MSGAGAIAAARRQGPGPRAWGRALATTAAPPLPWQLRWQPVSASTEVELDRRLAAGLAAPVAVIARRQTRGHGQQGRVWQSPAGGVWLSAALPWSGPPAGAAPAPAAPALAVALGLALELERLGLEPQIKWPNDLLLHGRKLAGILPRLRWRGGRLQGCRVGVGINGWNRVPPGAIALAEGLQRRRGVTRRGPHQHPLARPDRLTALVLRGLEWAAAAADQGELVRRQAAQRLWRDPAHRYQGRPWQVEGLELDGSLRLRAGELVVVRRWDF